jgi:hypothetical protein
LNWCPVELERLGYVAAVIYQLIMDLGFGKGPKD